MSVGSSAGAPYSAPVTSKANVRRTRLYVRTRGRFREARDTQILQHAQAILRRRCGRGRAVLTEPAQIRAYLQLHFAALEHEVFGCLFLDGEHRLIEFVELFRGTLTQTSVHAREVVKEALARNAGGVILYHYVAGQIMEVMCPRSFCGGPIKNCCY
ncbi:MAG TPA: JAB domain-containing protein [Steroidobacteraceae bacterium]|jgi:DNA repair protein RadC